MDASLTFFAALFGTLPPRDVPIGDPRDPVVIVYTDASYDEDGHSGMLDAYMSPAMDRLRDWLASL